MIAHFYYYAISAHYYNLPEELLTQSTAIFPLDTIKSA